MSHIEVKKIIKKYARILKEKNFPFSAIYLFGSYAKGKANKWSDIDVAVVSDNLKKKYWDNQNILSRISLGVDTRLEPHGFTLEDFMENADPTVYEIKKTGIKVA